MYTSYFAISNTHPNAVSIAGRAPEWYHGREYKKLAPTLSIFKKYKADGDTLYYTEHYYKEVLQKLDPKKVFEELGPHAVLLCYETPGKFCHRHLVAKWLSDELGVEVLELKK